LPATCHTSRSLARTAWCANIANIYEQCHFLLQPASHAGAVWNVVISLEANVPCFHVQYSGCKCHSYRLQRQICVRATTADTAQLPLPMRALQSSILT
jgi:hypothetical protein